LLAVDPVGGDRGLPFFRYQPVHKGPCQILLDVRVARRIDQHHAVLVEQSWVSRGKDNQFAPIPE